MLAKVELGQLRRGNQGSAYRERETALRIAVRRAGTLG